MEQGATIVTRRAHTPGPDGKGPPTAKKVTTAGTRGRLGYIIKRQPTSRGGRAMHRNRDGPICCRIRLWNGRSKIHVNGEDRTSRSGDDASEQERL